MFFLLGKRRRINKYFAEGKFKDPDANPEQITGKQEQLLGKYHCSKHAAMSKTASILWFPDLLFLNTLAKI